MVFALNSKKTKQNKNVKSRHGDVPVISKVAEGVPGGSLSFWLASAVGLAIYKFSEKPHLSSPTTSLLTESLRLATALLTRPFFPLALNLPYHTCL